jgi:oligosaccharyltransferase complex subunit alpha (ribophorin I)
MGYNLPAENYLGTDQQNSKVYVLNVPFSVNFDNAAIDEITVRVILPEGATDIEVHTPFPIDGKSSDTHYTYLDTSGRPVLIVNKKNIVAEHNRNFQVTYRFSQMSLFQEPFLLIVAFFLFFLFIMVYVRLEFNIGPTKTRNPNQDKLDDILLRVKDLVEQRAEHHEALDDALSKAIKGKNVQPYTSDRQRVENLLNQIRKEVLKLITEAEGVDGDATRRLREVEKREETKAKSQAQLHDLEISFRFRKTVTKTTYDSTKDELEKALNTADEELESLVSDLTSGL